MKSKRRHELQTNELADQLGNWIEKVRPHLATFALITVAAVAFLGVWYYWASNKEHLVTESWRAYMFAGSNPQGDIVKELKLVAEDYSDTQAGLWAAQTAADVEAGQAVRKLFTDKATAETGLAEAVKGYEEILSSKSIKNSPMLQRRAHFGLAQTLEASGELTEAIKHYQAVVDSDPDSGLAKASQRRADHLSQDDAKKWYNWFANQTPVTRSPASSLSPLDDLGTPGTDLGIVPDAPSDDFMQDDGADVTGSAEPAKSSDTDESSDTDDAAKATAAKEETEPANAEPTEEGGPTIDGPSIDGPSIDPPATEPLKEDPATVEEKDAGDQ